LLAAHPADAETPKKGKDYTILKIGKDEIKRSEVEAIWKGIFPAGEAPDFETFDPNIRMNVLRGIVSEKLLYITAKEKGLEKQDVVKARIDSATKQIIVQAFLENQFKDAVSEDKLKAEYETKKGQEEVKARHILLATEEEAKEIHKQLTDGADFDKLAKEKSLDKVSAAAGGDLGYFTADRMVPEFSKAAFSMSKGDLSEPVKSDFGWHVIKVEDKREKDMPPFEQVKDQLKEEVTNKVVQEYVQDLLNKTEVSYFNAEGDKQPFPKMPGAAPAPEPAAGEPAPAQ